MKPIINTAAILLVSAGLAGCATTQRQGFPVSPVTAVAETTPMPSAEDAADDPAIWIHPTDPMRSTIIGTNKQEGLGVYSLSGELLHYYPFGRPNNVDIAQGVEFGGARFDLVGTEDRSISNYRIFRVEAMDGALVEIPLTSAPLD